LVEAIKEYHHYLSHQPFTVFSDHISLTYLQNIKQANGRLLRWSLLLQNYPMTIKFKRGLHNPADALSRREYPEPPSEKLDDDVVNDVIHYSDYIEPQPNTDTKADIDTCTVINLKHNNRQNECAYNLTSVPFKSSDDDVKDVPAFQQPLYLSALKDIAQLQRECYDTNRLIMYIEQGELPQDPKLAR